MSIESLESVPAKPYEKNIGILDIYESYKNSPYLSIKWSSYFQVYAELFEQYRDKPMTFVEVGVSNGGSLFMWRDYFGPKARVIGIDLNPLAKKWEQEGFEIHIGDQSDPIFWETFFASVGLVDVVLDDGGHRFEQQIVTAHHCIAGIRDGGLMIVEDTHTNYLSEFGYPSKYSFIEWARGLIDNINSRHFSAAKMSKRAYKDSIYSVEFFESIVAFKIDRKKCFDNEWTSNDGITCQAEDFRFKGSVIEKLNRLASIFSFLKILPGLTAIKNMCFRRYTAYCMKKKVSRYF